MRVQQREGKEAPTPVPKGEATLGTAVAKGTTPGERGNVLEMMARDRLLLGILGDPGEEDWGEYPHDGTAPGHRQEHDDSAAHGATGGARAAPRRGRLPRAPSFGPVARSLFRHLIVHGLSRGF